MTVDYDNAFSQGIIGLQAKVLESPDSTLLGIAGTIVFETKNTIFIRKDSLIRQIAKSVARKLEIQASPRACFISGSALIGRPEDRISRFNNG